MLRAVAVEATRRRAGAVPERDVTPLPPAGREARPQCSAKAAQLLELTLAGQFGAAATHHFATEWLSRCARAGHIVPVGHIVALLDLGAGNTELRPDIRAVLGRRGQWVAARHDRWRWAATGDEDDDLDAAALPIDVLAGRLEAARRADADAGRELVVATVEGLAAADRARLYESLAAGLSPADEPLLESLLDERSAKIRAVAADLLARLPDSAWVTRAVARLAPLVTRRRGRRFEVALPEELGDDAVRDGIVAKPPGGTGRKAWWLRQLVAAVPLPWWEETVGADPPALIARAPLPEVRAGWVDAAGRHGEPRWAAALFDTGPDPALLPLLGAEDAAARLIAACRGKKPFRKKPTQKALGALLDAGPDPWSPQLTEAVLDYLSGFGTDGLKQAGPLLATLTRADASALDTLTAFAARFSTDAPFRLAVNHITFRTSLDQEFA